ncbi:MAG: UDP-N-acetylmuramate--L-alanine ligase, partial [Thermotoga sp.]
MKIHFVGIGGMGMSALAIHRFLMGDSVSGSDIFPGERTMYLKKLGLRVEMGHSPDNLREADLVIASRAVPDDNVELIKARK